MRVCLISREYPPDTGWGGIATFAYHLAHGLKELGHDVEVVSLTKPNQQSDHTTNDDGVLVHRVALFPLPGIPGVIEACMPYSSTVIQTTTALWKKFLALHKQKPFDVIDTPELLAEGLYQAVTKVAPLTIRLYTPHSKFIAERLHNVTPSFDHQFVAMLERVAMLSADTLTSPSDDLANYVASDLNYPREKIQIVRNPIDPSRFGPEGTKYVAPNEKLTVLFVGRLEERKGIGYLIKAVPDVIQICPKAQFVVIGNDTKNAAGQRSVLAELKADLKQLDCEQYVNFISHVPLTELPSYYRSADVCVVPSVYDNSPYTCLEAMSCGKAVIGTDAGGTPEYIVNGESGLIVPSKNINALIQAITKLLEDESERTRLGINARQRVLEKFQRKEIAGQMIEIYKQAQGRFLERTSALYLKQPEEALNDAITILDAYNQCIYGFLYLHSWRFRIKHWLRAVNKNPQLFVAKLLSRLAKPFSALICKNTGSNIIIETRPKCQTDLKKETLLAGGTRSSTKK